MSDSIAIDTHKQIDAGQVPIREADGGRAQVPAIGLGTWELVAETCVRSILTAVEAGYRHFDTARAYENEREVGKGLAESHLDRSQYWLTSKAWHEDLSPGGIRSQAEESLRQLGVDYLDLFLIHWPNEKFRLEESLEEMTRLVREQKIRFFGVSNFTAEQWITALDITPAIITNQVEYHPFLDQHELLGVAEEHGAFVTAYSPLASGMAPDEEDETLKKIARRHGKSVAQVSLRWLIEQPRVVALPRSSNEEHIRANIDLFDFELTPGDCEAIADLPKDRRQIHPKWAPEAWGPPPGKD